MKVYEGARSLDGLGSAEDELGDENLLETDEGEMARRERLLRARLGLPLGLIERVETNSRRKAGPA